MKKLMAWLLAMALLVGATGACAEEGLTFEQLSGLQWEFSSGAGGWATELRIDPEGGFIGQYHDSEMGEAADDYPDGTVYYSDFTGTLSIVAQVGEHIWKLRVDSLKLNSAPGEEDIDGNIRFVATEPYGISEGDEMTLYLPGAPLESFSQDMLMWAHLLSAEPPTVLEDWFLYSLTNDSGFVGYPLDDAAPVIP